MKKKKPDPKSWGDATKLVRGGLDRTDHGETSEALFLNSGFVYDEPETAEKRFAGEDDGYVYGRYGNPTVTMFEERLALLEGAEACYAVASGMAAVFGALACQLKAGDHLVASKALFGSCYQIVTAILPRFGIRTTLVDGKDLDGLEGGDHARHQVRVPRNAVQPDLEVIDLEAVCAIAKAKGANIVVDNIFATPILQRPLAYGADVIVYSGTKHMDGQGRVLGGAIVSTQEVQGRAAEALPPSHRPVDLALQCLGAAEGARDAEAPRRGPEPCGAQGGARRSKPCRASPACSTRISTRTRRPHSRRKQMTLGGTMVTFEVAGGKKKAFDVLRNLGIIDISNNLGDAKSLMTHPASTTHRNIGAEARAMMGITDGMLRLSVGLEDTDDLIGDLKQAMQA